MDNNLRIVMFPWLAFGHLIPYLEFAKLIAQKGHQVFFISTPRNIDRLPKIHPRLIPHITFVKLSLPRVENLPKDAEATIDVPSDKIIYLKQAYDELHKPMTEFLESSCPDWILRDFSSYWLSPIAVKLGIKIAFFSTLNPAFHGIMGPVSVMKAADDRKNLEDLMATPSWVHFPTTLSFPYYHVKRILDKVIVNKSDQDVSDISRFAEVIDKSDIIAVRGSYEFEPEWFQVLDNIYQKPIFPLGHFPTTDTDQGEESETWGLIKDWLDKQNKGSVVYVGFGSEAKPTKSELTEIALGLEQSELPFFWALKTRRGSTDIDVIELPEGFEERTRGRGIVFTSWVPQLKILGHDSVGGFLSHTGWNSVMEAIHFEKALIMLGFFGDQGINTKFLAEKKLGYAIPRDELDGSFTRSSVMKSVRLVMVEEEGNIYREKMKEMRPLFVDKDRQDRYVVNFLEYLKEHKHSKKQDEGLDN